MKTFIAATLVSVGLLASGGSFAATPVLLTSLTDGVSVSAKAKVKPAKRAKSGKRAKKAKTV
jgi:hypothetical protein